MRQLLLGEGGVASDRGSTSEALDEALVLFPDETAVLNPFDQDFFFECTATSFYHYEKSLSLVPSLHFNLIHSDSNLRMLRSGTSWTPFEWRARTLPTDLLGLFCCPLFASPCGPPAASSTPPNEEQPSLHVDFFHHFMSRSSPNPLSHGHMCRFAESTTNAFPSALRYPSSTGPCT